MENQKFDVRIFIFFLLLVCLFFLLACDDIPEKRYYTQGTNLQTKDLEGYTFDMYENNTYKEKWKFTADFYTANNVKTLYTIQGNVFIIGNDYRKNNYSYKATNREGITTSIEFTKILLPKDSVQHSFKLIKL